MSDHTHSAAPALQPPGNPVLVEVTRGNVVESFHSGAAAIVSSDGTLVRSWGNVDRPIYARSAIKPLQALPLVETGAADHFKLSQAQLALACASHNGDERHVGTVQKWLSELGYSDETLECGPHLPYDEQAAHAMLRAGEPATRAHNNCSGKHTGFLSICRHLGEETEGYTTAEHPAMQRVEAVLSEMTDTDLSNAPRGADGCGIPVIGVSLRATAYGIARMAVPKTLGDKRGEAAQRLTAAMMAEPHMVAGRGRFCTRLMTIMDGAVFVKTGAEGVFIAGVPSLGLGIALKIDDGAARASEVATAGLLKLLGVIEEKNSETLSALLQPPLFNRAGTRVGELRAHTTLLG
ncbi:MAG: asparaginase [Pseudomonadota bacterium]